MTLWERIQLAVDKPEQGAVVVRVAGALDRETAPRLVRLVKRLLAERRGTELRHLVVDVGSVSTISPRALDLVRQAADAAARRDVQLHLTGIAHRRGVLPASVEEQLTDFPSFPTIEDALDALCPVDADRPVTLV